MMVLVSVLVRALVSFSVRVLASVLVRALVSFTVRVLVSFSVRVLVMFLVRSLASFPVKVLARGGVTHPEKPVSGSLVQLILTLLHSQARKVEITRPVPVVCYAGPGGAKTTLCAQFSFRLLGNWEWEED